jgi:serine phosphatase RsbU (regulator of sigma subunit)
MVNESLRKITDGNLNEVVSVYSSSEFASLSNDINQTVDVLKRYISEAEKRIEQELEFAKNIQESALPHNFSFPRNDFEIYASMDAAKEVGGDFYDFFFVDVNKICLVIADVSGKGIPAALFMMRSKTVIRGYAESGKSPSEIFSLANNGLCEGNDANMFVTVWIGIIDLETGHMVCSNAGHEIPAIMRAGGAYELYKQKHNLALGIFADVPFREYEIDLAPGDSLFVYTDGAPEAINEKQEEYGTGRLIEELNKYKLFTQKDILNYTRKNIAMYVGEEEQFDDVTMLGFKYNGPPEK